ncbi:MAG: hypothetical protein RLZZ598_514, partial [Pseudomonadota bacterium]
LVEHFDGRLEILDRSEQVVPAAFAARAKTKHHTVPAVPVVSAVAAASPSAPAAEPAHRVF